MANSFMNINKGIAFKGLTADPTDVADGDIWYRSDLNKFYVRTNSTTSEIGSGGSSATSYINNYQYSSSTGFDITNIGGSTTISRSSNASTPMKVKMVIYGVGTISGADAYFVLEKDFAIFTSSPSNTVTSDIQDTATFFSYATVDADISASILATNSVYSLNFKTNVSGKTFSVTSLKVVIEEYIFS